jgi:TatD DNase family protein
MYIDSHSHLADPRFDSEGDHVRQGVINRALKKSISFFLQAGVGPEDWDRQKQLQKKIPQLGLVYGLHPYWVAAHTDQECEEALDQLALILKDSLALGETGLDLRAEYVKSSFTRQIDCFEKQLEMARVARKAVVLHLVRAFSEVKKIFFIHGPPSHSGFVHSFSGDYEQAQFYLDQGLLLSFGGPLTRQSHQRLREVFAKVPLDRILLETDSPDQKPQDFCAELNEPSTLWQVAELAAKIKGISTEEILDISSRNLRKLLSL